MEVLLAILGVVVKVLLWLPYIALLLIVLISTINAYYTRRQRDDFSRKVKELSSNAIAGILPADENREEVFHVAEMSDVPATPMIVTGRRGEVDATIDASAGKKTASWLALLDDYNGYFLHYAADGRLWTVEITYQEPRLKFLAKVLAETVYNPVVEYQSRWKFERSYTLYELREMLCLCVDIDDDSLTQWTSHDKLKKRIREAESFDQVLSALKRTRAITSLPTKRQKRKTGSN